MRDVSERSGMKEYRGKILRLPPNRVWRTYRGGLMLDRMEGRATPADAQFPEDWLGSTVRAINPNSDRKEEGMAHVMVGDHEFLLASLIEDDPIYFLGAEHIRRFGNNPMILVKYLDSAIRLPFQVHPTVDFSMKHIKTTSGKTEAYYILSIRPDVEAPFIYLGFQRPPTRQELRRMIETQDIDALESCFDKIPVKPGDVYVVPGGLPHAIGGGVLMVEVMEPTDFVVRVEFNIGGLDIPTSARFMGRDIDFALDMFSLESWPAEVVESNWRCEPMVVETNPSYRRESLVDDRRTDRFRLSQTILTEPANWESRGFTILIVVEGSCVIATDDDEVHLAQYDRILVPDGLNSLHITPHDRLVLLECKPPCVRA
jgi:mannose-6-phosphate isomerase